MMKQKENNLKPKRTKIPLLRGNLASLIGFELLYKSLLLLLGIPFFTMVFNISIRLAGYRYLANDNFFQYLFQWKTISILILMFLILNLLIMFEMCTIIKMTHASFYANKVSISDMFKMGFHCTCKSLLPQNWGAVLWIIFMIPLLNTFYLVGFSYIIKTPSFFSKALKDHIGVLLLLLVCFVLLSLIALMYFYCIPCFVIEKKNILRQIPKNLQMISGHYWITGLKLILWNIFAIAASVCIFKIVIWIVIWVTKLLGIYKTLHIVTLHSITAMQNTMMTLYILLFVPMNTLFICRAYFVQKIKKEEPIEAFENPVKSGKYSKKLRVSFTLLILFILMNNLSLFVMSKNRYKIDAQLFNMPIIMAHRGASAAAPENTLAAFQEAMDSMSDWIELDVRMTSDEVVVVTHDSNLKRVAGVNKRVGDITYEQLRELEVGSTYSEAFRGEKIPTLEEVLELTAGKIKLNIELKPIAGNKQLEEAVVSLIYEYEVENTCMICSTSYDSLKKVKELAPDIQTTYVISMVYSDFWRGKAADAFSLSSAIVTKEMIYNIKSVGKEIYVWTVNTEDSINKFLDMGVDGIITDDPSMAQGVIFGRYAPEVFQGIVDDALVDVEEDAELTATEKEE